jgi:peroxiredoxin Q/BCP
VLEPGDKAPDFELQSDAEETVQLSKLRGQKVILYFYPKDNTSGCTTEACDFRDRLPDIRDRGAVVLGVSPDGIASHQKFKAEYDLPFALLSDPDHKVAEVYGAWGEKKNYGKTYQGMIRSTFLIDEDGIIA